MVIHVNENKPKTSKHIFGDSEWTVYVWFAEVSKGG